MARLRKILALLVLFTDITHSMVNINYEGPISTNSFKWWLGATISRKHLVESVDNMKKSGKQIGAKLSELRDRTEEEKVNLGQGGNYNLFHHKLMLKPGMSIS